MGRSPKQTDRPGFKIISVTVNVDGKPQQRSGADLNSVIGGIVWDIQQETGDSQVELAERLGLGRSGQQNVSRILRGEGTRIEVLSRICAALREFPTTFFQRHERYRVTSDAEAEARFAEDRVFGRFRACLTLDSARRMIAILSKLNAQGAGAFEDYLRIGERLAGIDDPGQGDASSTQATAPRPTRRRKRAAPRR